MNLTQIRFARSSKIENWEVNEKETLSDHCKISFRYNTNKVASVGTEKRYNIKYMNWLKPRALLREEIHGKTLAWVNNISVKNAISNITEFTKVSNSRRKE